jgi:hypothetical protein
MIAVVRGYFAAHHCIRHTVKIFIMRYIHGATGWHDREAIPSRINRARTSANARSTTERIALKLKPDRADWG